MTCSSVPCQKRIHLNLLDFVLARLLDEFKSFALKHPEYAKIFTTYLDLQTSHVFSLPEEGQAPPAVAGNKVSPEKHDEGTSDKKDD